MHAVVKIKKSKANLDRAKVEATLKAVPAGLEIAKILRIHKAKNAKKAKLNDKKSPR